VALMYLAKLMTTLSEATKLTFDTEYPEADFRNLHVGIEYPQDRQHYPGIWIDFEPAGEIQIAGVDHHEYTPTEEGSTYKEFSRWTFAGWATFTIVTMSSFERARLYDEMVRVLAFGKENERTSEFRRYIENNEFLAVNFDFDQIGNRGFATSSGTPWGSDELIYEATIAMECFGEFVSYGSGELVPLSAIVTTSYPDTQTDPTSPGGWM
jgi:hypothetical protein